MSDREFFDIMLMVLLLGNEFGERLTHEEKGEPCIDVFRWKQTLSSVDDLFMFPGEGWSMGRIRQFECDCYNEINKSAACVAVLVLLELFS